MTGPEVWDPVWGPRREPNPKRIRMVIKRTLARLASVGRSARDRRRGVVILAYHGTGAVRGRPWWMDFRGQMNLIEDLGYRVVSLSEAVGLLRLGAPLEKPTLAITFDDGFANNLDVAYPELARRNWPATVFVTTAWLGRRPFFRPEELPRLGEMGVEAGNHTHTHPDLRTLDAAGIHGEVAECARRLEDLTGRRPRHFCYPNGLYDRSVRDAIAATDLESSCSSRVGFNAPGQDPYVLNRLTIERGDRPRHLRARLAGGYGFLDLRQRHRGRS